MAEVRVGGAYFTFSADANPYAAGVRRVIGANAAMAGSYGGLGRQLAANTAALDRFSASLTSSLVATLAYAAGVGAITTGLRGTIGGFLDYDKALIEISKTTGIAGDELERLGERLVSLGTDGLDGYRALGLTREALLEIAAEVGRAGIQSEEAIARLTRSAAALDISSNLGGGEAVQAITRITKVTGEGVGAFDKYASVITHLGNNLNTTEAELAAFLQELYTNTEAVGGLSDALTITLGATLIEAGARRETAAGVSQRLIAAITDKVNEGQEAFVRWGRSAGVAVDEVNRLYDTLISPDVTVNDRDQAILVFLQGLSRLRGATGDDAEGIRQQFVRLLFGEDNIRTTKISGVLDNFAELETNARKVNEALSDQTFHLQEAGNASEAYHDRLEVVGSQILKLASNVGGTFTPTLVAMAEQWQAIGIATLGFATAIAGGKIQRAFKGIQASLKAQNAAGVRAIANSEGLRQQAARELATLKELQARRGIYTASFEKERIARAQLSGLVKTQNAAEAELTTQRNRQAAATAELNRQNAILEAQAIRRRNAPTQEYLFGRNRIYFTPPGVQTQALREQHAIERQIFAQQQRTSAAEQSARGRRALAGILSVRQRDPNDPRTRDNIRNRTDYNKSLKETAKVRRQLNKTLRESIPTRQAALAVQRNLRIENERLGQGLTAALGRQDRFSRSLGLYAVSAGRVTKSIAGLTNAAKIQRQQVGLLGATLRGATRAFHFMGGGLGVALLGFTVLLPTLTRFIQKMREAGGIDREIFGAALGAVNAQIEGFEEARSPVTNEGQEVLALVDLQRQYRHRLFETIQTIEQLGRVQQTAFQFDPLAAAGVGAEIEKYRERAEELEAALLEAREALKRLNDETLAATGQDSLAGGVRGGAFRELEFNAIAAAREIRAVALASDEVLASRIRVANAERAIVVASPDLSPLEIAARAEIAQSDEEIAARLAALLDDQLAAKEAIEKQTERVNEAEKIRLDTLAAARDDAPATEQANREKALLATLEQQANTLEAQIEAVEELRTNREGITAALLAENHLLYEQARVYEAIAAPDLSRARTAATSTFATDLLNAEEDQRRFASIVEERLAGTAREAAGIRAANDVMTHYLDALHDARIAQSDLSIRILETQRALAELEAQAAMDFDAVGFVDPALLEQITAMKDEMQGLNDEFAEQTEYEAVLRGFEEAYRDAAAAAAAFAEAAHEGAFEAIINDARRLEDNLEAVIANGFNALGDEITQFVQTGKFEFKEFANSIIADLLRVLVQAQIVAPLVTALAPGASSAIAAVAGGTGLFHSGGIAGQPPTDIRRRGGLRQDEIYAILQKGEEVITANDPRHRRNLMSHDLEDLRRWTARLPRFHSGGIAGVNQGGGTGAGGGGITINLRNESRAQLEAVDDGQRITADGIVRSVILRDARVNGPITRGLRGSL